MNIVIAYLMALTATMFWLYFIAQLVLRRLNYLKIAAFSAIASLGTVFKYMVDFDSPLLAIINLITIPIVLCVPFFCIIVKFCYDYPFFSISLRYGHYVMSFRFPLYLCIMAKG